ncbi:integrating conjugative element protein [Xenorhabdus bovienii]|uniref:integrating conjugative element protein n=1 Tax=Xenorhabdus bovienii TaxID=40576 RepID=UPI0023B2EA14|nr:integrating conjugative element protein [Xenorhabdus bovienii]MDE9433493.1 integrating conjugative element protein [Xenorhabdus bovienii]MDE9491133.1 integrating conjugative element protein [Xenorhabdus bovienii]MDE9507451.1 integrating conjugative element protein [Xenorhabdus bovienii]
MAYHIMIMKRLSVFPIIGMLWFNTCHAELNVIADLGGKDASLFYESINAEQSDESLSPVQNSSPEMAGEAAMLPVKTPELTPGKVADRALQLPGIGALFLIGDDPGSRQWLSQNAAILTKLHAVGLVVNVSEMAGLQTLRASAPDLLLSPASGTELARRLQLQHYPVLITETALSQQLSP